MRYSIGIDIGTSGTKTILADKQGRIIASSTAEYPLYQLQNGYAEQDPLDWYNAVIKTVSDVIKEAKLPSESICGVGLSGQMHGLVMLDENNEIIRPAIIWCDTRAGDECERITGTVGANRLFTITANRAVAGFTAAKILWVRKHEPQNYARCRKILLPKDYVRFRLTGEFATDVSDASGMQLLDVKNRCWSDDLLARLDIDKSLLCKVYESVEPTGAITDEFAKLTDLRAGTLVVAGAGDNAAAAVGTGVVEDGKAFITIGTSGVVYAHTSEMKLNRSGGVHTFCSAVPNEWHVMGVTQAAGLSLKWFRDNLCKEEIKRAEKQGIDSYYLLDEYAEKVPVGSNRLIYLPYLMGERTPHLDTDARGVFFGLSASHTKADMIRAVMEGVGFSLKDCAGIIKAMNIDMDDMILCGGGGKSKLWRSILSDILDLHIAVAESNEGAALGSAILAFVGAGEYKTVEDACGVIIKSSDRTTPDAGNSAKYEHVYDVYRSLYPQFKASFKKLKGMQI